MRTALVLSLAAGAAQASDLTFQTVVLSGDPAPGLAPLTFEFFSDPRLTTAPIGTMHLTFRADLAGAGVTEANNGSIWSDRAGTLALVAREGDPSPIPGINWGAFPSPLAASGNVTGTTIAFTAALVDPQTPNAPINVGLFMETTPGGGFQLVAREGEQMPGFPPATNFSGHWLNVFTGAPTFTSNKGAVIWVGNPVAPVGSVFSGQPAPGVTWQMFGQLCAPVNRGGSSFTFFAPLVPTGAPGAQPTGFGVFFRSQTSTSSVAVTGQGAASGVYKQVSAQPVTIPGPNVYTAWWASMTGGSVNATNDTALFVNDTTSTLPRVREGDPATGAGAGVFFGGFSRHPAFSELSGTGGHYVMAFTASLVGSGVSDLNNSGIWLVRRTGNPALVAREGNQVPRLPAGTVYASFGDPVINTRGQVVFFARLRGPGVTQENGLVLMATERAATTPGAPAGKVTPIVRTGDAFAVAAGDTRIVHEILFDSAPVGAGATQLTDDGVMALKLNFRDPIVPTPPPPQLAYTFTSGVFLARVGCLADINADGALTIADFGAFQSAYVAGDLRRCDFSGDGVLTIADFGAYQSAFVAGCP